MIRLDNINDFTDDPVNTVIKRGGRNQPSIKYSENIYTFDIETSSLFNINGKWKSFDYSINDYSEIDKRSCVYISMFGVNGRVYYFRNFMFFDDILRAISDTENRKIIFIHNLSYEFQFLRMILKNYTVDKMLANAPHKPITFYVPELNIEFRCSYRLTNLSLAKSAEKYTDIEKKTGDLDYTLPRSPITRLTPKELDYCEYDILTLYNIIKWFKHEYKHVYNIPYTQTGEVRRDLKKRLNFFYFEDQKKQIPPYEVYLYLMSAFMGGITHANMIWSNKVIKNVYTVDEASAYPTMMLTKKYPYGQWLEYDIQDYEQMKDFKAFIFRIKLHNLKSKLFNHYLSSYKCVTKSNVFSDNGRIVKADMVEIIVTDCDYEMIKQSYAFDKIEYIKIIGATKKYLDKRILKYILDLYKQKTELKGIAGQEDFYMKAKQRINSLFGCACTNPLNQDTYFTNNEWGRYCQDDVNHEFMKSKIESLKDSTNYFQYSTGVWITAYNRAALWQNIINNDKYVVYYDTDSIKSIKPLDLESYNKRIIAECEESAVENDLDISAFAPLDKKGIPHPLGVFEHEDTAIEFITLGAKKYCARYEDGLHLTVSGVQKAAVTQLDNDIYNFTKDTVFDYSNANKNIHYYTEQEPFTFNDYLGNEYICTDTYGIVLQPTTYTLSITNEYESLLQSLGDGFYNE